MKVISTIGGDGIRQVASEAAILSRVFEIFMLFHCYTKKFSRKTSTQCNLCYFTVRQHMKGFSMKGKGGDIARSNNFLLFFFA